MVFIMSLLSATIISGVYSFLTNVHSIIPLNYDYDVYKDCDLDHARWFAPSGKSSATSITFDGVNCQAADDPKLRNYCQRNVSQSMANSGSNECASHYKPFLMMNIPSTTFSGPSLWRSMDYSRRSLSMAALHAFTTLGLSTPRNTRTRSISGLKNLAIW